VRVAGPVVDERATLQRVFHGGEIDVPAPLRVRGGRVRRKLQGVECHASVAVRDDDERAERVGGDRHPTVKTPRVGKGALDDEAHLIFAERLEDEHARARQQCGDDLERRVLGRRPNERHVTLLDEREHRVLLGLVEAMDLVDEHDGPLAGGAAELAGLLDHAPQVGNAS